MAKSLNCGDIMPGCNAKIEGANEQEVMTKAAEHAKQAHGISEISSDVQKKVSAAIKDR